jgi:hypothetical protein
VAASKDEHLAKVSENTEFLKSIDSAVPGAMGWCITVLFYGALHYVEAYFCTHARGHKNHFSRAAAIQQDARIKSLYNQYRDLENLSREARYDVTAFNIGDVKFATRAYEIIEEAIKSLL